MTIEKLEKHISELKNQQAQLLANMNAVAGAINNSEYWLKELIAEQAPTEADKETT